MSAHPAVSVITPTYNRAAFIGGAIESVLAQTSQDWELVIVNDGATDDTEAVIERYRAKEPRIRYVKQANAGLGAARNRALAESRGTYVAFLDDDDRWTPEKLKEQVAFMETHPETGFSYARSGAATNPTTFPELLRSFKSISPSTVMMRRDRLVELGGFAPLRRQEDYDLWLRFAQRWPFAHLDKAMTIISQEPRQTLSGNVMTNHLAGIAVLEALQLTPENRRYRRLKDRKVACLSYLLAREYYAGGRYWAAAAYFVKALRHDPIVGVQFRRSDERGVQLMGRVAKSYAAVPFSLVRGVLHAAR